MLPPTMVLSPPCRCPQSSSLPELHLFDSPSSARHFCKIKHGKIQTLSLNRLIIRTQVVSFCTRAVAVDLIDRYGIELVEENGEEDEHAEFDYKKNRVQVQEYVDRIKARPFSDLDDIFDKDWSFCDGISEFNDFLTALVIENQHELAFKYFKDLSSYDLVPNSWTFSIMVRSFAKKGEPELARQVLDYMLECGFKPNVVTFTVLVNAFCRKGKLQNVLDVFDIMSKTGVRPSIQTYNCVLKGLCYVGKVEDAYDLLTNVKNSLSKPDIYSYTAVMDGFCKVGRSEEAKELLDEALEMGLKPTVVTYNTLFNGYCKQGVPLKGVGLLKRMKEKNCLPDYVTYSTLLHGLLKWGKVRLALQIYREMVSVGLGVDERMMNTLLRGLCRKSWKEKDLLNDVYDLFDEMKVGTCVVYPCAYGLAIQTLCIGKEITKAADNLREMVKRGHSPRMVTVNSVIRAFCKDRKIREAMLILVLMCEISRIPSRISFNLLIDECNQQGKLLAARNVYGAALKLGVTPHSKPQSSLGTWLRRAQSEPLHLDVHAEDDGGSIVPTQVVNYVRGKRALHQKL